MNTASDTPKPVVEESPTGKPDDLTQRALQLRIRQQEILSELGVHALQGAKFDELVNHTARLTAEGLEAEYCKVMQYMPEQKRLLVLAGVGWDAGVIGKATVGADLESPAGFALRTGKPVISNHLENEERFRTPELLVEHGIRRAMNVILQGDGSPFGVLEVDSRSEGEFSEHDLTFLQGAANVLGMAIERQRYERSLKMALDRHEVLLGEINHRVKNSLQVVASMLQLQSNAVDDTELRARLAEASSRVMAVGRAYERLAYDGQFHKIDLSVYLHSVILDLQATMRSCELHFESPEGVLLAAERAIPLALIVNELVTNATKYAYPGNGGGKVWVTLAKKDEKYVSISVRDEGVGMPAGFDPAKSKRLGTRLIKALTSQLNAELKQPARKKGTEFELLIPLEGPKPT
jgi:two-component sensor histidine kinase